MVFELFALRCNGRIQRHLHRPGEQLQVQLPLQLHRYGVLSWGCKEEGRERRDAGKGEGGAGKAQEGRREDDAEKKEAEKKGEDRWKQGRGKRKEESREMEEGVERRVLRSLPFCLQIEFESIYRMDGMDAFPYNMH